MGKDEKHKSSRSKHKHKKHSSKHKKDRKKEKSGSKRRRDRSSSPSSSSSSGSDAPRRPAVAEQLAMGRAAARAVREILAYSYDLRAELRELARHLDSGAALDVSGVADSFLRSRLTTAFDNLIQLRRTSAGQYLRVSGGSSVASFVAPFLEETPAALASYAVLAAPEPAPSAAAEVGEPVEVGPAAPEAGPGPGPAGEEGQEAEEAAAPAGPALRPEGPAAEPEAAEGEIEGSRRVLGPAMPPPEVLAAAAAMEVPPEAPDAAPPLRDDDLGDLVGPPPPEFAAETEVTSMDDRAAEVARVLRVLEEHATAAAAAPLAPAAAGAAPEPPPPDAYLILGVDPTAPAADIKRRYWRLSLLIHPDKCDHPAAAKAFQAVSIAAAALQDAAGRAAVDNRREAEELRRFTAEYAAAAERERAWRVARGEATAADLAGPAPPPGKAGGREAWMTELPEVRTGPVAGPPRGNQTTFSTRGSAPQVDASVWTMTPQERAAAAAGGGGPAAGPGMLTAGPNVGEGPRGTAAAIAYDASTRGKSLLEKHLERQEKAKRKEKGEEGKKKKRKKGEGGGGGDDGDYDRSAHPWRPFDRAKDLERKPAGAKDPKELLKNVKGLSSRFAGAEGGGGGGRSFL